MRVGRSLRSAALFLTLVVAHYLVAPFLTARVSVDLLVIALLLVSVRLRPGVAAALGFVTGLVADTLNPSAFGAGALALSTIGYGASWLKAVFFADNVLLHASFFFAGKWTHDLLFLIVEGRLSATGLLQQMLIWTPLSAALTAIAGIAVVVAFRAGLEPRTA